MIPGLIIGSYFVIGSVILAFLLEFQIVGSLEDSPLPLIFSLFWPLILLFVPFKVSKAIFKKINENKLFITKKLFTFRGKQTIVVKVQAKR